MKKNPLALDRHTINLSESLNEAMGVSIPTDAYFVRHEWYISLLVGLDKSRVYSQLRERLCDQLNDNLRQELES